jgi:hypothetical protein
MPRFKFNDLNTVLNGLPLPIIQGSVTGFSSPFDGGHNNPYGVHPGGADYVTVCLAKIDGFIFGMFTNCTPEVKYANPYKKVGEVTHAEDAFINAFIAFAQTPDYAALQLVHQALGTQMGVTLKLNRTPCNECAPALIAFKKDFKLSLRIKAIIQYMGKNTTQRQATQLLVQNDIPVIPFNVFKKVEQKSYERNRFKQLHELAYVRFDEKELEEACDVDSLIQNVKLTQEVIDTYQAKLKTTQEKLVDASTNYKTTFETKTNEMKDVVLYPIWEKKSKKNPETALQEWAKRSQDTSNNKIYRRTKPADEDTLLRNLYKSDPKRVTKTNEKISEAFLEELRNKLGKKSPQKQKIVEGGAQGVNGQLVKKSKQEQ